MARAIFAECFGGEEPNGTLGEIADITMGQSPAGTSYNEDGNGKMFYQGRAEFGSRFPTQRLFTTEPKRMATKGDVLLSVRAPVGDFNIANEDCCIGRGLAAIRSKHGYQSFVLYSIIAANEQLNVFNGTGTVFGSINKDALANLAVFIPDTETLQKFEDAVRPLDSSISANTDDSARLAATRDSLLPKLMSGKLSVADGQLARH